MVVTPDNRNVFIKLSNYKLKEDLKIVMEKEALKYLNKIAQDIKEYDENLRKQNKLNNIEKIVAQEKNNLLFKCLLINGRL